MHSILIKIKKDFSLLYKCMFIYELENNPNVLLLIKNA